MMVMDSYALPVEGTETRVNAQAQAYEYMATYMERAKQVQWWYTRSAHDTRVVGKWRGLADLLPCCTGGMGRG